ncbi:MAG: AAA family ATPase [Dehalococcoidia bacterium]
MDNGQRAQDVKKLREGLGPLPEAMVSPPFVVVSGLPGTGKTHFCHCLMERYPFVRLESDTLRKVLFAPPTYSPEESVRLFQACHQLIEELLDRGIPLIFDSTNLSERHREQLYHIADRQGARLILVRVEAPQGVVQERLEARVSGSNPKDNSDANWKVYQRMKGSVQQIRRAHFAADTSRDLTPVIDKILRELRR